MNKSPIKPVIFVIISLSLVSLAVTSGLQQQTAMALPKFDSSRFGQLCKVIYETTQIDPIEGYTPPWADNDFPIIIYLKFCGPIFSPKDKLPHGDPADLPTDLRDLLINNGIITASEANKDLDSGNAAPPKDTIRSSP